MNINQTKTLPPYVQYGTPKALTAGKTYEFFVEEARYIEHKNILQVIFVLHNTDSDKSYSLLEDFIIGSQRYESFIKTAYAVDSGHNCLIAVDPSDLTYFWGECKLAKIDGRLSIDINSIDEMSTPCSALWNNQAVRFDYYKDPTFKVRYSEDGPLNTVADPNNSYIQSKQPDFLNIDEVYRFEVVKVNKKNPNILQVVFELRDTDSRECYLLEEFTINSHRYSKLIEHAYVVDTAHSTVIEFAPRDMCNVFSGRCKLNFHKGKFRIDFDTITPEGTLLSRIHDEQLNKEGGVK